MVTMSTTAGKDSVRQNVIVDEAPQKIENIQANNGNENSALLQSMYDYTIVPTEKVKKRMDYFYTPYNQQFLLRKHMTFDENDTGGKADAC